MLAVLASVALLLASLAQRASVVGAWFAAHPFEGLLLAYLALNVVNASLPARVAAGPVGRLLAALLDRAAVLTRSDASGTLKWPAVRSTILRIAVDAVLRPGDAARLTAAVVHPEEIAASDARFTRLDIPQPVAPALPVAPAPHGSRAGEPPRDPSTPAT